MSAGTVSIGGVEFQVDTSDGLAIGHQTLPKIRQQIDTSVEAGEASLNTSGPWRRTITDWSNGAGQEVQDGNDSIDGQYWTSEGVDPWTEGEMSVLPNSEAIWTSTSGQRVDSMVSTPFGVFVLDRDNDTITRFEWDGRETSTDLTSDGITNAYQLASDGNMIWVADLANGIWRYYAGTMSGPVKITNGTNAFGNVWYANGRLIAQLADDLYDLSADSYATSTPVSLPSAWVNGQTNRVWGQAVDGQGQIYLRLSNGQEIYRTAVLPDGTALDAPRVAATLPAGEPILQIYGYLGFVIIATWQGLRLGVQNANGDLTIGETFGPETNTSNSIPGSGSMIGRGRFVYVPWFGGRTVKVDLSRINGSAPAWSFDVAQSPVTNSSSQYVGIAATSVDPDGTLYVGGPGGLWRESDGRASTRYIDTGDISYSIPQEKIVRGITADLVSGTATPRIIAGDGSQYVLDELSTTVDTVEFDSTVRLGTFRVRLYLSSDAVLKSFTVLAYPTGPYTDEITVPLVINEAEHLDGDRLEAPVRVGDGDVVSDAMLNRFLHLRNLRDVGEPVAYVEGAVTWSAVVNAVAWLANTPTRDGRWFNGTAVVTMRLITISSVGEVVTPPDVPTGVETFNIVDESANTLVDELANNIVWSI